MIDRLAIRRGQHDAPGDAAIVVRLLADDVVVEHGLVHRNRQRFVSAEPYGVPELSGIVDPLDVERAHTDAVRADADADALARELVLGEERVERIAECRDIADLAANDDSGRKRLTGQLHELRRAVVDDTCRCQLRRADLEPDDLLLLSLAGVRCRLLDGHR